jgi:hypothetical protein
MSEAKMATKFHDCESCGRRDVSDRHHCREMAIDRIADEIKVMTGRFNIEEILFTAKRHAETEIAEDER